MKLLTFLLTCVLTLSLGSARRRIYKGEKTTIEEHPYQIALFYNGFFQCGGSILNENTIVTAAHCLYENWSRIDDKYFTIRVGSTIYFKGEEYHISKVYEHNEFSKDTLDNDVAVMKLARPLKFSKKVQPIELQASHSPVPVGTEAYVSGWGRLEPNDFNNPDVLRGVNMYVVNSAVCKILFQVLPKQDKAVFTDNMLCARNVDRGDLNGDSGGPLVANGKLIGIVSWSIKKYPYMPHVYANVAGLHDYIAKYL